MTSIKIRFEKLPMSIEEFISLSNLESPQDTAALFIVAMATYVIDKDLGIDMINHLKGPEPLNDYGLQFLRNSLMDKPYLPYSYFDGSNPQNNYEPTMPLVVKLQYDTCVPEEGYEKLLIQSSGTNKMRSIILRKKGSQFFLWEYGGLLSEIKIPIKESKWI